MNNCIQWDIVQNPIVNINTFNLPPLDIKINVLVHLSTSLYFLAFLLSLLPRLTINQLSQLKSFAVTKMLSIKALIPTIIALATSANASPVADPLAFADAVGIPVGAASYSCHASCGNMIIAARSCTPDGASDGGYDSACLCASSSEFMGLSAACLDCGWCLWSDYSKYLTSPLGLCNLPTNPTGTECAPTPTAPAITAPATTAPATTAPTTTTTPAGTTTAPAGTTTTPAGTTTSSSTHTTSSSSTHSTSSSAHTTSSPSVAHVTTALYHNGTTSTVTSTVCSSCHVSASVQTFTGAAAQVGVAGLAAFAGAAAFLM